MIQPAIKSTPPTSVSVIVPATTQVGGEMDALLLGKTRELVAVSPERRNWRGIFIALLVIAAVCSLIIFSIFLLSPEDEGARVKGRRITLTDIIGKNLKWTPFNGSWTNNHEIVFRDPAGGLSILNLANYTTRILMTNSSFRQLNAESFVISPDQKFVLLVSDSEADGARYNVYEIQSRNKFPLTHRENVANAPKLQLVKWAPCNSSSSNNFKQASQGIVFVHENDIFYKPKVQGDLVCRITSTGEEGIVFNGISDWLYSNTPELKSETLAFSPSGLYLSFLTFNDSLVNEYKYMWMGDSAKYPKIRKVKYPKAETTNPNVTVFVVNLSVLKYIFPRQINLPFEDFNGSYIGGMAWTSAEDLTVTVTDRRQTKSTTFLCHPPSFVCHEVYTEVTTNDGWLLPAETPIFSATPFTLFNEELSIATSANISGKKSSLGEHSREINPGGYLLKRLPVRDGEHGYYRHVVFISSSDRRAVALTMGQFEVTEILGWDESNEVVYYMAAPEQKPGQRHLFQISVKLNKTNSNRVYLNSGIPRCLTCDNSQETFKLNENENDIRNISERTSFFPPNNCLYNKIYFKADFSHYVQECLGPEPPSIYLVETQTNNKVFVLHAGDLLRKRINQLALPQDRVFSVEIRHGFHAQVRLFLPPGMKEEEEEAFPMILHLDGSPGTQLVSEKFDVNFNWYLCSQRSFIVAQIDARGSGFQGELLRTQIHGKLGTVDVEDQLGVLTYLRDNLKFIDPTRICAYGLGYGGYSAIMTLVEDSQQVLQCSVAINPIVSFAYHYSFFTERYIPLNGDYLRLLQESDLTMKAGNIKGRNLMLIHSTADTLVHQEHAMMLARSLIDQEIKFRQQLYTDEDHTISGSLYHLYKTIEWYIDECFGPLDDNEWDPTGFFVFKQ